MVLGGFLSTFFLTLTQVSVKHKFYILMCIPDCNFSIFILIDIYFIQVFFDLALFYANSELNNNSHNNPQLAISWC